MVYVLVFQILQPIEDKFFGVELGEGIVELYLANSKKFQKLTKKLKKFSKKP